MYQYVVSMLNKNNHFVVQPLQTPSRLYLVYRLGSPTAIANWHSHWSPRLYVRQNPLPYAVFPVDLGVLAVLESHATMLTTPAVLLLMSPTRLVLSGFRDSFTLFRSADNPDTVSALALDSKLLFYRWWENDGRGKWAATSTCYSLHIWLLFGY